MRILLCMLLLFCRSEATALGDVRSICEKTGVKVLELKAHDQIGNRVIIQNSNPGKNAISKYLKQVNVEKNESEVI